jgi:hypothetical protein
LHVRLSSARSPARRALIRHLLAEIRIYNQGPDARPSTHPNQTRGHDQCDIGHFVRRFTRAAPLPYRGLRAARRDEAEDGPDGLHRAPTHSIINGSCKRLIRLASASSRASLTVRCTATSRGIPLRSFHHRSTSIENSRRVHDGQLSPSVEIYRVLAPDSSGVRRLLARHAVIERTPASKALSCCRNKSFGLFLYRHDSPARARHVSAHPLSAPRFPSTA